MNIAPYSLSILPSPRYLSDLSLGVATAHGKLWKLRITRFVVLHLYPIIRETLVVVKGVLSSTALLRLLLAVIKSKIWVGSVSLTFILCFRRVHILLGWPLLVLSLSLQVFFLLAVSFFLILLALLALILLFFLLIFLHFICTVLILLESLLKALLLLFRLIF